MGSESTFDFAAVVILAVVERPGRQFICRRIEGDHDLEVLGFFGAGGGLRRGHAGRAKQRLIADQGDVSLEGLAGNGVDADLGGLADLDVDDVSFVDLDLGGNDAHVGDGHEGRAFGVLNAFNHGLAFADRLVGHDAVKRCDGLREVERVLVGAQGGYSGIEVSASRGGVGLGLVDPGDCLRHGGNVGVVGGLLGVVVLLGHDAGLIEALRAIPIELFLLEVGFRVLDVGFTGLFRRYVGGNVRLRAEEMAACCPATWASCATFSTVATSWPFFT